MNLIARTLFFLTSLFSNNISTAQSVEVIDNKKIIELSKAKLGDEVLIGLIQSSKTNFSCGISSILEMKKDSVSDKVITEIMKYCNENKEAQIDETNSNNPLYKHPSGIYVFYEDNSNQFLKKLYPNVVTQEKSGGFGNLLAKAVTYGLANSSKKASLNGSTANVKAKVGSIFYFYFEPEGTKVNLSANTGSSIAIGNSSINVSGQNWWFSKAISPNEFTLIKLKENSKNREFKVGKGNDFSDQQGVDQDSKITFSFEEIKAGVFKVQASAPLKAGEYCFLYSSTVPAAQSNDRVFDFSIIK